MFNVVTIPDFLDAPTCNAVLAALRTASSEAATVTGGYGGNRAVDSLVRKTRFVTPPDEIRTLILDRLTVQQDALAAHYGVPLQEIEPPQFLRYEAGDYFVAHQDGNTPLIHDATRFRKVSVVIFVNAPHEYEGGELVLHGRYPDFGARHPISASAGLLAAFPSETTHEVLPVRSGERYTIVTWYRAAERD
jgi:predicted 2-oxoglutarate/Fe(II)-dependent dioxygenase YbiX